jgi:transposase
MHIHVGLGEDFLEFLKWLSISLDFIEEHATLRKIFSMMPGLVEIFILTNGKMLAIFPSSKDSMWQLGLDPIKRSHGHEIFTLDGILNGRKYLVDGLWRNMTGVKGHPMGNQAYSLLAQSLCLRKMFDW